MTAEQPTVSQAGPIALWAILDARDGGIITLEGRPGLYDSMEAASRAVRRTTRPLHHVVVQVARIELIDAPDWVMARIERKGRPID